MTVLRAALALLAIPFGVAVEVAAEPVWACDWPEPGGGPRNDMATDDVEPPRSAPVERWRATYEELLGEPVVAGGVVYVAARTNRSARLFALSVESGEELAAANLKTSGFAHVSVAGTTVVVVTPENVYVFERRKDALRRSRVINGTFATPATLLPGAAAIVDGTMLRVIDLHSGDPIFEAASLPAKPAATFDEGGVATLHFLAPTSGGRRRSVRAARIEGLGTREPVAEDLHTDQLRLAFVSRRQAPRVVASGDGAAVIASDRAVRVAAGGFVPFFFWPGGGGHLPAIASDPMVWKGVLYGRSALGMLVEQPHGEAGRGLLPARSRPDGAVDGPITCARGVLLLGNYALDRATSRVLWTAPDLKFSGPLIPAADGVVVFHDSSGSVVAAGAEFATGGSTALAGGPSLPPSMPGSGDAVILDDGTRIPGLVEAHEGGTIRIVDGDSEPREVATADVSVIEKDGRLEIIGEPYGAALATRDALELELARDLGDVLVGYAKRNLIEESRRLLVEVRERGLPDDETRALEELLANRKESIAGNRERQLVAARRKESEARDDAFDRTLDATRWLAERSLPLEASDVLARALRIWPRGDAPADARQKSLAVARALVPAEFPWAGTRSAERLWLDWAPQIAAARGRFVAESALPDLGEKDSVWREHTIALRTKNILLLSRSDDPRVVGACLRHGEAAVRTLDRVLENPPREDDDPLEIRIHGSRDDYLEEDLGEGVTASPWSLGFYSPVLRVSRFHVPEAEAVTTSGRQLHEVVAHELTHQYIAERWHALGERKLRSPVTRGFWVVEGFARFIEDQSLEMGRRGQRMDDATVQSVEAASALAKKDALIQMEPFIEAPQVAFLELPEEPVARVDLRTTLVTVEYSAKSLFYEQAGALVFFMMNRRGDDGRARFLEVLRDHYRSETQARGWRKLGFETARALESAYLAFLRDPEAHD